MTKVLIFFFLIINTGEAADNKVCNLALRLNTGIGLQVLHTLYDIKKYFTQADACGRKLSAYEELINALLTNDESQIEKLLKKIDDDPKAKLLSKIISYENGKSLGEYIRGKTHQLSTLSSDEANVLRAHPYKGLLTLYMYDSGVQFAQNKASGKEDKEYNEYFQGNVGSRTAGRADAYRHMMMNALASRYGISNVAEEMGTAHEKSRGTIVLTDKDKESFNLDTYDKYSEVPYSEYKRCYPSMSETELQQILHQEFLNTYNDNQMDLHNNRLGMIIGKRHPCANKEEISKIVINTIKNGLAKVVETKEDSCQQILVKSNVEKTEKIGEECRIKPPELNKDGSYACPSLKDPTGEGKTHGAQRCPPGMDCSMAPGAPGGPNGPGGPPGPFGPGNNPQETDDGDYYKIKMK